MKKCEQAQEVIRLEKRLKAAKSRALYWSGNPTFIGRRFNPSARRNTGGHSEQYELALCDIDSLSSAIERITGARPQGYDPKVAFQKRWHRAMAKMR